MSQIDEINGYASMSTLAWTARPLERPRQTTAYSGGALAGEIHVWQVRLDVSSQRVEAYQRALPDDEIDRAGRFYFQLGSDRFIVMRYVLRTLLGQHTGIQPDKLRFGVNDYGKPYLLNKGATVRFNISHSAGQGLIAISKNREVGVDIEIVREDASFSGLAARYFSPAEISSLQAVPDEHRSDLFFRIWTRKEAYIKARGLGMAVPLNSFDVSPGGADEPIRFVGTQNASAWFVRELPLDALYRGAVAAQGTDWQARVRVWSELETEVESYVCAT
jgi:4'-phosphopantetheinyl transferase